MKKLIIILLLLPLLATSNQPLSFGVVKFYSERSNFGYIENETDVYRVYDYWLIDEVIEGDLVSFNYKDTRNGLEAFNVRKR